MVGGGYWLGRLVYLGFWFIVLRLGLLGSKGKWCDSWIIYGCLYFLVFGFFYGILSFGWGRVSGDCEYGGGYYGREFR